MTRTVIATAEAVRRGDLSALQSVRDAFARIERLNPALTAFVQLDRDAAERAAIAIDARIARGEPVGPLAGVPIGVKDIEPCAGFRVTQGSWFLRDSPIETEDSGHVARLRAADAIPVGITAMSEFGMDSATHTHLWGTTRNPWNLATTPGGSSGGSAAAVAAGLVPLATGTDAGGSIREPAAFTGLVGLKPSHGRIAKRNGFANWSVVGALTRTVADTARYLDVAAGPDDRDRQSLPAVGYRYEAVIETLDVRGLKAVWSPDLGYAPVEPEVVEIARRAAERLMATAGLIECRNDFAPLNVINDWGQIQLTTLEEDFTRQGILPGGIDRLSASVRYFVELMRDHRDRIDVPAAWKRIYRLEQQVAEFFAGHDLLLTPATACRPYAADALMPDVIDGRDASETHAEPFGPLANVCWNPAISIPAGITSDGLPVGLQVMARRHRDDVLLRLARLFEQAAPWSFPFDADR
jgi:aspartyl-tRNA(Asn)/glutamyl-tRNA(Gln) amidotransferase subunit A